MTPQKSIEYESAKGKTVKWVKAYLESDWIAVDIRFTDDTALSIEIDPIFHFKAEHNDWKTDKHQTVKKYPIARSSGRDAQHRAH